MIFSSVSILENNLFIFPKTFNSPMSGDATTGRIGGKVMNGKVDPVLLEKFRAQQKRSNELQETYRQRPNAGKISWVMLSPTLFMPPIMMTRFIKNVVIRERSFKTLLGVALVHSIGCAAGFYDTKIEDR